METKTEAECCPPFDPELWEDKIIDWDKRKFIRDKVLTLFFMPLNFGKRMRKLDALIRQAGGSFVDNMGLSDHTSKWNMNILLAVDKDIPGAENTTLSGRFYSKVYEGSYSSTGKWCQDFEEAAKAKELAIDKWYIWYTTCPKCARKYGKNYTVIIGKIE